MSTPGASPWPRGPGFASTVPITIFDASTFPVRIAAEVKELRPEDLGENPERWQHHARQTQFAVAAAIKAGQQAGRVQAARPGVSDTPGCA